MNADGIQEEPKKRLLSFIDALVTTSGQLCDCRFLDIKKPGADGPVFSG